MAEQGLMVEQGDIVRLSEDPDKVRKSFDDIPFIWADMMIPMCGQTFTVLEEPGAYSRHLRRRLPPGVIALASPDGSQGNTWFFSTAVVERVRSREEHALVMKYAMSAGKGVAGIVRFIFEDVVQGLCQVVFLIKKWHTTTRSSKAFTIMSISTGIALSLFVPLKECVAARALRKRAASKRPELVGDLNLDQANQSKADATTQATSAEVSYSAEDPMATTIDRDMYIAEYLQGKAYTAKHASLCYKALVASSGVFWTSMVALTFAARPSCGGDQPWLRYFIFMAVTCFDLVVQAWVLLHSKLGYHLIIFKPRRLFAGVVLTILGHFDSFADVTFAGMLQNCDEITEFTIKEQYFHMSFWRAGEAFDGDRVFPLPLKLADISFAALAIGVFVFQALPGMCMLFMRAKIPVAFKMNELNLLLTLMDEETLYMEGGEEATAQGSAGSLLDVARASAGADVGARLLQD